MLLKGLAKYAGYMLVVYIFVKCKKYIVKILNIIKKYPISFIFLFLIANYLFYCMDTYSASELYPNTSSLSLQKRKLTSKEIIPINGDLYFYWF